MFATLIVTAALFILPAIQGVAADFNIDTPKSLTACEPVKFTWEQTKGPYNLVIVESSAPCGAILADLGDHDGTSFSWDKAVLPASFIGKQVTLSLEDGNGDEAWSQGVEYSKGKDDSCYAPKTTSSSSSAASSLTVIPGTTTIPAAIAATPKITSSSAATPVGAANAGTNPFNSALTAHHLSGSVIGASVIAVLFALTL